ncbi:MAG: NUDIX hydrolase [Firmicutes bacterium]|nr:NUDIX hydrolase [Bacillota bacterium]
MDYYATLQAEADARGIASTVVGLVVARNDRILLLKRRPDDFMPNLWEIPGGHVDPGETLPEALRRELWEETALTLVRVQQYLGYFDYDGEFGRTRQWNFLVDAAGDVVQHPEHSDAAWASREEARRLPMTAEMRHTVERYWNWRAGLGR